MKRWLCSLTWVLVFTASPAWANFHLFQIEQLFSNADGTVQFIVLHEFMGSNDEHLWGGQPLISTRAGVNKTFLFPKNLPSRLTAGRRVLVATQGFAALGIVTPDYVIPNGFLPTDGGTLTYAGVDTVNFASLPADGTTAITRNGTTIQNLATNFAGDSASVAAVGPPAAIVPVAGVWWNPNESGSGFGLDYKDGTLIVEVYSYLPSGASQWYLAAGPITNNVFTATLDKYIGGQCISCAYAAPTLAGNDGTVTITFTSPTSAIADLPGGRHIPIQRFLQ